MAATQVVLYFDRQEDALLFTLAASSAIAADEPVRANEAMEKIAKEICKVSRITTGGILNSSGSAEQGPDQARTNALDALTSSQECG